MRKHLIILIAIFMILAGCRSKNSSFYVLSPIQAPLAKTCGMVIGLGPVTIPRYLDQPQIVTRLSPNQVALNEFERWAEPLNTNITSVLANNLKAQLHTQILLYPWQGKTNYEIKVTITRFDTEKCISVLNVNWDIRNVKTQSTRHYEAIFTAPVPVKSTFNDVVAAMNMNLNALSFQIAKDIKKSSRA